MEPFSGEWHHTNRQSIKAVLKGPKYHAGEVILSWPGLRHRQTKMGYFKQGALLLLPLIAFAICLFMGNSFVQPAFTKHLISASIIWGIEEASEQVSRTDMHPRLRGLLVLEGNCKWTVSYRPQCNKGSDREPRALWEAWGKAWHCISGKAAWRKWGLR